MSQNDLVIANQSFPSFRTDLNSALQAINSSHSGSSIPSGAVAGTVWLDTSGTPTSNILKIYDGTDSISLAIINFTANTVDFIDSAISTPLAVTGNATAGAELRLPEDTDNGSNYVALKAADSIASNLTLTLPSADGTSGQVLQTNGSGVLSFATVGGLAWQTIITGATLSAVASRGYWINTTSNACTVTLPASATNGDTIILADYARKWGTNAVTINQNGLNFQGSSSVNPIYNTDRQSVTLVYSGATQGWIPTVDDDVSYETPTVYSADFLVIAGGGGGGEYAGGGGAGGYRTSYSTNDSGGNNTGGTEADISFSTSTVYTITVGAGGSAGSGQSGNSGNSSSISGAAFTTITSSGGGFGKGGADGVGSINGGSGGGHSNSTGGTGTANQGFAGGNGGSGNLGGGGGGGAKAVGVNGGLNAGGNGGAGHAGTITGTSVTRAGGGGGGADNRYTGTGLGGSGGAGGGGAGTNDGTAGAGTANTGSGGGSGGYGSGYGTAGAGGSGVVILRMLTANYSGTTTGSPTVTTSGADTIIVYNASGSYTG